VPGVLPDRHAPDQGPLLPGVGRRPARLPSLPRGGVHRLPHQRDVGRQIDRDALAPVGYGFPVRALWYA
jgi:hypothetical protein